MNKKLLEVAKFGTYYNPANKHYDGKDTVTCDRCQMADIGVSIGYNDLDICLVCAHVITDMTREKLSDKYTKPISCDTKQINCDTESSDDKKVRVTKMKQRMYTDTDSSEEEKEQTKPTQVRKMMGQRMYKQKGTK